MGFGTLNLFSFFQQPNTGVIPTPGTYDISSIVSDAGKQGRTSDQNWEFPYAGTSIPYEIYEGGGAAYQVRLLSDSDVGAELGNAVGLRVGTVYTVVSGKIEGGGDQNSQKIVMSGIFWPKAEDIDTNRVIMSGNTSGSPPDKNTQSIVLSGVLSGSSPDKTTNRFNVSGILSGQAPDNTPIKYLLSGSFWDSRGEKSSIRASFSGNFLPVHSDKCIINYQMLSFSTATNRIILETLFEDECLLNYGFNSYYSTRP